MTSYLLYKTRCPDCAASGKDRSGDNLGVYSDGHTWCYSCSSSSPASLQAKLNKVAQPIKPIPPLPDDISFKLSNIAHEWLSQYFSPAEFPKCFWSISEKKLYFILPNGEYQYRYFGDNPAHPKWVGAGIGEHLFHVCGTGNSDRLVLVEDLISAIKVGHITPTLCLFGSNIPLKRLATIKQRGYTKVTIWLDFDKCHYAVESAKRAQSIGLHVKVIHTIKDPKDYTTQEIIQILNK